MVLPDLFQVAMAHEQIGILAFLGEALQGLQTTLRTL